MSFDLVLMDMRMPLLDGVATIQKIRSGAIPGCPSKIPLIAVTAFAMPGDRERFHGFGATDYISKPIDARALLSTVWQTLAAKGGGK